jgi:cytidylate kinase
MPVITVSRLTGSGGAGIGQRIAERLGASYLNSEIIGEVAQRLGVSEASAAARDERGESFSERLARALWVTDPALAPVADSTGPIPFESTTAAFVQVTRQVVQEAAGMGNAVIFGHGSQFILAGRPGVLHVRFVAPLSARIERMMRRAGVNRAEAERRVRTEDQRRAAYVRQYYNADWHASDPFHLILNTALWDETACVGLVLAAVTELTAQAAR